MIEAKILDPNGNKLVMPPFLYGNAIVDDDVTMIAEECHVIQMVDSCKMFLPVMARRYNVFDLQYMSIPRIMGK